MHLSAAWSVYKPKYGFLQREVGGDKLVHQMEKRGLVDIFSKWA